MGRLSTLSIRLGLRSQSFHLWHAAALADPQTLTRIDGWIDLAMGEGDITLAAEFAALLAELRWGSSWYPPDRDHKRSDQLIPAKAPILSAAKLRHDVEQFLCLQRRGLLGAEFTEIVKRYERLIDRLVRLGDDVRQPLAGADLQSIGHVYNRLVHVRETPRVRGTLFGKWDAVAIEDHYLGNPPGVVVVDDFLSAEALFALRMFCIESTVWSTNRYAHGRLGSFFRDGFNCPLLIQIAEDLRNALPRVIGDRHPLRQIWGFKYGCTLPGDTIHADFAAVNVNFWITPDDANREPGSGGLVVYDAVAPLDWDFPTYNRRGDIIRDFLRRNNARALNIPHRQNRAVIFNSDLFHATAALNFRAGYENRRINVTMLYGDRTAAAHRSVQNGN